MSDTVVRGRYYPDMPPALDGETPEQYTDRLTGADGTDRRPYDHFRRRQCSIGYHDECSDNREQSGACECPHHTDPNYLDAEAREREELRSYVEEIVKDAFYTTGHARGTLDDAAFHASQEVLALLIENEYL